MIAEVLPDPGRATRPARAEPEALLRQAEIRGERMAALFRIIIFLTLLLVVGLTDGGLHRFDISFWTALYAPKNTPKPIIDKLAAAAQKAMKDPAIVKRLSDLGTESVGSTPAELDATNRQQFELYRKLVQNNKSLLGGN